MHRLRVAGHASGVTPREEMCMLGTLSRDMILPSPRVHSHPERPLLVRHIEVMTCHLGWVELHRLLKLCGMKTPQSRPANRQLVGGAILLNQKRTPLSGSVFQTP